MTVAELARQELLLYEQELLILEGIFLAHMDNPIKDAGWEEFRRSLVERRSVAMRCIELSRSIRNSRWKKQRRKLDGFVAIATFD